MNLYIVKYRGKEFKVKTQDSTLAKSLVRDAITKQTVYNILVKHSELFKDYAAQVLKNSDVEQIKLIVQDAIKSEYNMLDILKRL